MAGTLESSMGRKQRASGQAGDNFKKCVRLIHSLEPQGRSYREHIFLAVHAYKGRCGSNVMVRRDNYKEGHL